MKTEQLIPLCRRYHAMLLHSDEQTISIAVVDTPPAELMEAGGLYRRMVELQNESAQWRLNGTGA